MMTGKITRVMLPLGYGFVRGDDGKDYFMHVDALANGVSWDGSTLRKDRRVEFDIETDKHDKTRFRAINTRVIQ